MGSKHIKVSLIIIANLLVIYFTPRVLSANFGAGNPWTSFWFQYIMGALVFGDGVLLIKASKAYNPERTLDRFWYKVIWGGFFCYFIAHASWIWLAQNVAVRSV